MTGQVALIRLRHECQASMMMIRRSSSNSSKNNKNRIIISNSSTRRLSSQQRLSSSSSSSSSLNHNCHYHRLASRTTTKTNPKTTTRSYYNSSISIPTTTATTKPPSFSLSSSSYSSSCTFGRSLSVQSTIQQTIGLPAISILLETCGFHNLLLQLQQHFNHRSTTTTTETKATKNRDKEDDSSNQQILACSANAVPNPKGFLRRWLELFHNWLQAFKHAFLISSRVTEISIRLSPLILLGPASYMAGLESRITEWAWSYTVHAVQGIGPVAVKFCQWMATRRDIFPPYLCDRLAILHDKGSPHSWEYTHQILTEAFGDYQAKGLIIDDVVGCGSAAQVYKGRIVSTKKISPSKNNNNNINKDDDDDDVAMVQERTVAIKVLHPNFTKLVERDLELIQIVAEYLHALPSDLIRMLNLPRATENFGGVLRLQADLTNEAKNLHQFRYNFYKNRNDVEEQSSISFPQPLGDEWKSTKNVLVEDFVHDAVPIADFLKDSTEQGLELRRALAGPLLRAFLKMVFMDNFVHGDLHPGNVLVKTDQVQAKPASFWTFGFNKTRLTNEEKGHKTTTTIPKYSIVFLDAGIANSLSPEDKRNLKDLFHAVIFNDGNRAGRLMVERAKYERCSSVPGGIDAFAKGVEDIVSEFHDRRQEGLTLGAVRIGSLLSRVLDLCRVHGVEIDPNMASVVLSTLVLEGLGRSLAPELNLIDFAKPFVLGLGKV